MLPPRSFSYNDEGEDTGATTLLDGVMAHGDDGWNALLGVLEASPLAERLVQVEMGENYLRGETAEIPLGSYAAYLRECDRLVAEEGASPADIPKVYLAQSHDVPELRASAPQFLAELATQRRADVYSVVSWVGPCGTYSPLHTDPSPQHKGRSAAD